METEPYGLNIISSLLYEQITSRCFPKKFMMSSFEDYSGATDPIQLLHQYRGYLREFILSPGQLSEIKMKMVFLETSQPEGQVIQYREIDAIFAASLI